MSTASVGMAMAGSCVVGSMTRSGRSTTHPRGDHEHEAGDRRPPGPAGVEQVEPRPGAEAAAERVLVDGRAQGDDVQQRAERT